MEEILGERVTGLFGAQPIHGTDMASTRRVVRLIPVTAGATPDCQSPRSLTGQYYQVTHRNLAGEAEDLPSIVCKPIVVIAAGSS